MAAFIFVRYFGVGIHILHCVVYDRLPFVFRSPKSANSVSKLAEIVAATNYA